VHRLLAVWLLLAASLWAQSAPELQRGSRELELFVQGGHSVSGGTGDVSVFNAGARYGWGLFSLGSGALRGNFEYAVEAIPIFIVAQPVENAYGAEVTPFDFKYNFTAPHRVTPFVELGGGVLFTNNDVPFGTSRVNFTPQGGIGMHIPLANSSRHLTVGLKYFHISNAGMSTPNPGINTIQFKLGFGTFSQ
jgi:lipid A 3-O-deacylase